MMTPAVRREALKKSGVTFSVASPHHEEAQPFTTENEIYFG